MTFTKYQVHSFGPIIPYLYISSVPGLPRLPLNGKRGRLGTEATIPTHKCVMCITTLDSPI